MENVKSIGSRFMQVRNHVYRTGHVDKKNTLSVWITENLSQFGVSNNAILSLSCFSKQALHSKSWWLCSQFELALPRNTARDSPEIRQRSSRLDSDPSPDIKYYIVANKHDCTTCVIIIIRSVLLTDTALTKATIWRKSAPSWPFNFVCLAAVISADKLW